jgi:HEAT repeat protein
MDVESDQDMHLVKALGDTDWRVRRRAIEDLRHTAGEESLPVFLRKLRHEHRDASVLNSILQVLTSMEPDTVPALIELTRDPDSEVRMYAALGLGDLKDNRAVEALRALLRDSDANVAYHAIEAVAKLKAAEAVDELAAIAEQDDFFLAFSALEALAAIGESRVAPRLMPLLHNEPLQAAAIAALAELGDESLVVSFVSLLEKPGLVPAAASALARLHDRYEQRYGQGEFIERHIRKHTSAAAAQKMLSTLNSVSGETLRSIVRVLGWVESSNIASELTFLLASSEIRREVIETLVRHGREVTGALSDQIQSENGDIRQAAVTALARIGDPNTVPVLVRALSDPELTAQAAEALSKIGDARAYEPLLQLLGHDRAAVRQAAVAALNSIGHPSMAADISKLLFNSNPHVREAAVRICAYFAYPDCAAQLLDRIHDVSENVRRAAVESLSHLQDDRVLGALLRAAQDESPKIRTAAVQSLGMVDSLQALPELLRALTDQDPWVRYYAARALGRIRSPEAIDALGNLVRKDTANQVRIAATDALGSIGGPRVVAILAPVVESDDSDLARAALKALGAVAHPDALQPIASVLGSQNPARRIDAVFAIATRRDDASLKTLEAIASTDPDPNVSETAIERLASMATSQSIQALIRLSADPALRETVLGCLSRMDTPSVEHLATAMQHPQPKIRRAVVDALSRIKDPHASELLGRSLDDEAASVRLAAVSALKRLGNRTSEKKLALMARSDPDTAVREAAGRALER